MQSPIAPTRLKKWVSPRKLPQQDTRNSLLSQPASLQQPDSLPSLLREADCEICTSTCLNSTPDAEVWCTLWCATSSCSEAKDWTPPPSLQAQAASGAATQVSRGARGERKSANMTHPAAPLAKHRSPHSSQWHHCTSLPVALVEIPHDRDVDDARRPAPARAIGGLGHRGQRVPVVLMPTKPWARRRQALGWVCTAPGLLR